MDDLLSKILNLFGAAFDSFRPVKFLKALKTLNMKMSRMKIKVVTQIL